MFHSISLLVIISWIPFNILLTSLLLNFRTHSFVDRCDDISCDIQKAAQSVKYQNSLNRTSRIQFIRL